MSLLEELLSFNHAFVENKAYKPLVTGRYPNKRMAIVACMDTRLTELLPQAMNIRNGDVKLIKTAGAFITDPFGGEMRSVIVAVSLLKVQEIFVIGHHDCGFIGLKPAQVVTHLKNQDVSGEKIEEAVKKKNLNRWLKGPSSAEEAVLHSAQLIRSHPLIPSHVLVHGLVIHPKTGKLEVVKPSNP